MDTPYKIHPLHPDTDTDTAGGGGRAWTDRSLREVAPLAAAGTVVLAVLIGLLWLLYAIVSGVIGWVADGAHTAAGSGQGLLGWLIFLAAKRKL